MDDIQDKVIRLICSGLPGPNKCVAPNCECYEKNGRPVYQELMKLLSAQPAEPVAWDFEAWQQNPYTKRLLDSISTDYIPRITRPVAPPEREVKGDKPGGRTTTTTSDK